MQTRLVADADLAQLDAAAELGRQIAHQFAEVDPALGGEVEDQPRSVEELLDPRQLHRQVPLADLQQAGPVGLTLALLVLEAQHHVLARRFSDDDAGGGSW